MSRASRNSLPGNKEYIILKWKPRDEAIWHCSHNFIWMDLYNSPVPLKGFLWRYIHGGILLNGVSILPHSWGWSTGMENTRGSHSTLSEGVLCYVELIYSWLLTMIASLSCSFWPKAAYFAIATWNSSFSENGVFLQKIGISICTCFIRRSVA